MVENKEGIGPLPETDTPERRVLVSVIMPVYNAAPYLREALDGLLSQTLTELELICVDDGSTDGCLDILKEYRDADERVRIVTESNAGISRARNNGLRRARGKYVAFLDADDFCEVTWLEEVYRLAEEHAADITVAGYDLYRDRIRRFTPAIAPEGVSAWAPSCAVVRSDLPEVLFQSADGYAWNKLFRREFLSDKGLEFPEDIHVFEDTYFVATALSMADRMCRTERVLLHHRVYHDQTRERLFGKSYLQIIDLFLRLREFLRARGMLLPLAGSYAMLSASRIYKVYNVLGADAKRIFWNRLHEAADALGWDETTPERLEDTDVAQFVANVEVYTYERYVPRLLRGVKLRIERLGRRRRATRRRRRVRSFLGRLLGREKKE